MAKTDIWFPIYIGEYLGDTMGLTAELHGAYLLLMFKYWRDKRPLPNDDRILAQAACLTIRRWRVAKVVLSKFFYKTKTEWRHLRIDRDLAKQAELHKTQSEMGKKAAQARWQNVNKSSAPHTGAHCGPNAIPKSKSKSDSCTDVSLLRGALETDAELMGACRVIFGEKAMSEFGGLWRKRIQNKRGKAKRVIVAMIEELKDGKKIKNPGGYANDLWKRFADQ